MNEILEDFSTPSLIKAMEANVQEAGIRWARLLRAEIHDNPEVTWFVSGLPFEMCNGVLRAQFTSNNFDRKTNELLGLLMSRQVPMAWMIGPSTRPVDLGQRLQAHGWFLADEAPGMAADLSKLNEHIPTPPGLSIEEVSDGEMLKQWMRVMTTGSDMPESAYNLLLDLYNKYGFVRSSSPRYYLASLNGEPVATSLLFPGGGVAGIYNVATLPGARRQGIGAAMTLFPLLEARSLGYRIGVLQSSQMGLNVYRRLGFQEYCTFSLYFYSGEDIKHP